MPDKQKRGVGRFLTPLFIAIFFFKFPFPFFTLLMQSVKSILCLFAFFSVIFGMGGNKKERLLRVAPHKIMKKKNFYPKNASSTPAATAEPMTPATFGPMACISKKLPGLHSCPTF